MRKKDITVSESEMDSYCQREFSKTLEEQMDFIRHEYILKLISNVRDEKAVFLGWDFTIN